LWGKTLRDHGEHGVWHRFFMVSGTRDVWFS
jgi:hypothetical protein